MPSISLMNDPRVKRGSNIRASIDHSIQSNNQSKQSNNASKPLRRSSPIARSTANQSINHSVTEFIRQTGPTISQPKPKYVPQSIQQMHDQTWQSTQQSINDTIKQSTPWPLIHSLVNQCHYQPTRDAIPLHLYLEDQTITQPKRDAMHQTDVILPVQQPISSLTQQYDSSLSYQPRDYDFANHLDQKAINEAAKLTLPYAPISGYIALNDEKEQSEQSVQRYQTQVQLVDQSTSIDSNDQHLIYDYDRDFELDLMENLIGRLLDHALIEVRSEEKISALKEEFNKLTNQAANRRQQLIEQEQKEQLQYEQHVEAVKQAASQAAKEQKALLERQKEQERIAQEAEAAKEASKHVVDPVRVAVQEQFINQAINKSVSQTMEHERRSKQAVDQLLSQIASLRL